MKNNIKIPLLTDDNIGTTFEQNQEITTVFAQINSVKLNVGFLGLAFICRKVFDQSFDINQSLLKLCSSLSKYIEKCVINQTNVDNDYYNYDHEKKRFLFKDLCVNKSFNKDVILGAAWGDEGKGRIAHHICHNYDWIIRTSGANNCGHSVYIDNKKYVYHFLPSVDFNSKTRAFLGSGMVIHPESLLQEILKFEKDFPGCGAKITIDPYAFLITDEHIKEDCKKNDHIGSTKKGVQPAYTSKVSRDGSRLINLIENNDKIIKELENLGVQFKTVYELLSEFETSSCLFEGAQGIMLDLNHGLYPHVTSADCTLSSLGSSGFNSISVNRVFGVFKAYTTRVGTGPLPTQLTSQEEDYKKYIVETGKEFGSTTSRERRIGWLDLPALKYACSLGGITHLIITKLDILNKCKEIPEEIPVCTSYNKEITGSRDFFDAIPEYTKLKGWVKAGPEDTHVKEYLKYIENFVNKKIIGYSYGTSSKDIFLDKI